MATKLTIGFLGAGKMATALARGFIQAELVGPKDMAAADPVAAEMPTRHAAATIATRRKRRPGRPIIGFLVWRA